MLQRRERLGSLLSMNERQYVYLTADAIEVDQVDGYDVTRRRVFLNDIVLVTLHHERRWPAALMWWAGAAMLSFPALAMLGIAAERSKVETIWPVALVFGIPAFLLAGMGLLAILRAAPVISIFGRRTKAVMRFGWRRSRALTVLDRVARTIQAAQAAESP